MAVPGFRTYALCTYILFVFVCIVYPGSPFYPLIFQCVGIGVLLPLDKIHTHTEKLTAFKLQKSIFCYINCSQQMREMTSIWRHVCTVFIRTNAPSLLIAPPPPPLYPCKVHISGYYIPLNSQHLCDSGIPKKDAF